MDENSKQYIDLTRPVPMAWLMMVMASTMIVLGEFFGV